MDEKYSLWLMPEADLCNELRSLILKISNELNSPAFVPHLTLIGCVEKPKEDVSLRADQLVQLIKPFKIKLGKIDFLDEYFRCVFIRTEETKELIRANDIARRFFSLENQPKFMPHLSLMYGNFPIEVKKKIASRIGEYFNAEFVVKCLHIYETSKKPEEWSFVEKHNFRLVLT